MGGPSDGLGMNPPVTSQNRVEGFGSMVKRGINGTHIQLSPNHLPKYVGEFECRWNGAAGAEPDARQAHPCVHALIAERLRFTLRSPLVLYEFSYILLISGLLRREAPHGCCELF
jgi:hypothetical protein